MSLKTIEIFDDEITSLKNGEPLMLRGSIKGLKGNLLLKFIPYSGEIPDTVNVLESSQAQGRDQFLDKVEQAKKDEFT